MIDTLQVLLVLLASSVVVVATCRKYGLPPALGYLLVGTLLGPHALRLVPDTEAARGFAEFGVVFLMFSIGLEFSLSRLYTMKRLVFGLGLAQVAVTAAATLALSTALGLSWQAGVAVGGAVAMSSTALLSKLLMDRVELDSRHGRAVIGVLLAQDLAVVPLLIVVPALSAPEALASTLALALLKAAIVLGVVLFLGKRLMGALFLVVARRRSPELFVLTVLLITLGLAYFTEQAGLSLALGAFLGGMLISETEYRYQVEEDIKPFRDVLLGLFFVTVGMLLNPAVIIAHLPQVLAVLALLLVGKLAIAAGLSRAFGADSGTAWRTGLWLAAGGEFGFVLLSPGQTHGLVGDAVLQTVVAALVLSLMAAPVIVQYSDRIVMRLSKSEWLLRSMELTRVAAQSMATERHVIICGYGRTGQYLARFLEQESIPYVALDLDPERVREAAAAGDTVVFGDAARRETLVAAGIRRAAAVVISYADPQSALRVLTRVAELEPTLPVVVRAADERDMERLSKAGAVEVVPETFEASIMLATHALALIGVPISRIVRRVRSLRESRYELMRGFFHGATDEADHLDEGQSVRLHAVTLPDGAYAIGRSLAEMRLEEIEVGVAVIRRRRMRGFAPAPETRFEASDVVVLRGTPGALDRAEARLLEGTGGG